MGYEHVQTPQINAPPLTLERAASAPPHCPALDEPCCMRIWKASFASTIVLALDFIEHMF
jgi:hypothetical protein